MEKNTSKLSGKPSGVFFFGLIRRFFTNLYARHLSGGTENGALNIA